MNGLKGLRFIGFTLVLVIFLSVSGCCGTSPSPSGGVSFPDPNLEAAVREAINRPGGEIPQSDLAGLETLNPEQTVRDLTGIEHCTGLLSLYLGQNEISDLSPLSGLTSLGRLILDQNQISDISPLSGLTSLQVLHLKTNQISDISPLSGLTGLVELHLGENQIVNISALSGLTNLRLLWLHSNMVSDLKPLLNNSGLGEGCTLDLRWNYLSDYSINQYIPQLEARNVTVAYQ